MTVNSVGGVSSNYSINVTSSCGTPSSCVTPSSCGTPSSCVTPSSCGTPSSCVTPISCATPSSCSTPTSGAGVSISTSSTEVNYSSATAKATSNSEITYGGASSTAKVSSTTSSDTSYSSYAHLGAGAIAELEDKLIELGFDGSKNGDCIKALENFRSAVGMEKYGIFSDEVMAKLKEISGTRGSLLSRMKALCINASDVASGIMEFKNGMKIASGDLFERFDRVMEKTTSMLETLGFYNVSGKEIDNLQAKGVPRIKEAMIHFGKVYGLNAEEDSFGKIYEKMTAVYSRYQQIVDSYTNKATKEAMEKMFSDMEINSDTQKNTFALTWTFLKEGMGLSDEQAAGVMGNIGWESRFSATNAQDKDGDGSFLYPGNDNSEDYNYKVLDGGEQIAYGLLQWKHEDRKGDLLETANEMGLSVGNINVQFALMQKESKGTYKDGWDNLKNCISYTAACDITQAEIEVCGGQRAERRDYAKKIYNAMLYI